MREDDEERQEQLQLPDWDVGATLVLLGRLPGTRLSRGRGSGITFSSRCTLSTTVPLQRRFCASSFTFSLGFRVVSRFLYAFRPRSL